MDLRPHGVQQVGELVSRPHLDRLNPRVASQVRQAPLEVARGASLGVRAGAAGSVRDELVDLGQRVHGGAVCLPVAGVECRRPSVPDTRRDLESHTQQPSLPDCRRRRGGAVHLAVPELGQRWGGRQRHGRRMPGSDVRKSRSATIATGRDAKAGSRCYRAPVRRAIAISIVMAGMCVRGDDECGGAHCREAEASETGGVRVHRTGSYGRRVGVTLAFCRVVRWTARTFTKD